MLIIDRIFGYIDHFMIMVGRATARKLAKNDRCQDILYKKESERQSILIACDRSFRAFDIIAKGMFFIPLFGFSALDMLMFMRHGFSSFYIVFAMSAACLAIIFSYKVWVDQMVDVYAQTGKEVFSRKVKLFEARRMLFLTNRPGDLFTTFASFGVMCLMIFAVVSHIYETDELCCAALFVVSYLLIIRFMYCFLYVLTATMAVAGDHGEKQTSKKAVKAEIPGAVTDPV